MTTPQKRKGTAWESEVVKFFSRYFPAVERRVAGNQKDKGDLLGIPFTVVECKDHKELKLSQWTDRLWEQIENAGAVHGVVIVKRARKTVSESYAVLPTLLYAELLYQALNDGKFPEIEGEK